MTSEHVFLVELSMSSPLMIFNSLLCRKQFIAEETGKIRFVFMGFENMLRQFLPPVGRLCRYLVANMTYHHIFSLHSSKFRNTSQNFPIVTQKKDAVQIELYCQQHKLVYVLLEETSSWVLLEAMGKLV